MLKPSFNHLKIKDMKKMETTATSKQYKMAATSLIFDEWDILTMSEKTMEGLKRLHPTKVLFQMNTSGSPSCWTDYGQYCIGRDYSAIMKAIGEVLEEHSRCMENPSWAFRATLTILF